MEEFQNLTRAFIDFYVTNQFSLEADKILDLVVDTYVTRPNINDPEQLRSAYIQVSEALHHSSAHRLLSLSLCHAVHCTCKKTCDFVLRSNSLHIAI